jgi:UrcA family protein
MSILVFAAAAMALPACAETSATVGVRFADLNLNQPSDAAVMLGRLDRAAMEACGAEPFSSLRELQREVRGSSCYAKSLGRAVAELNVPEVTAMYDRRAGETGGTQ